MAQLIVRKLEREVVQKLREQAAKYGVSMEEQHRRILRGSLLKRRKTSKMSLLDYLCTMPNVGGDDDFHVHRVGKMRDIDLSD